VLGSRLGAMAIERRGRVERRRSKKTRDDGRFQDRLRWLPSMTIKQADAVRETAAAVPPSHPGHAAAETRHRV